MTEMNAFENNEQEIPEVKKAVVDPVLDSEIARVGIQITRLKKLGLHRTAEVNQRKMDRLLDQKNGQEHPEG